MTNATSSMQTSLITPAWFWPPRPSSIVPQGLRMLSFPSPRSFPGYVIGAQLFFSRDPHLNKDILNFCSGPAGAIPKRLFVRF